MLCEAALGGDSSENKVVGYGQERAVVAMIVFLEAPSAEDKIYIPVTASKATG